MNTDPHTKANLFYTVRFIVNLDTHQRNGKIIKLHQKIVEYHGPEDQGQIIQH